MRRTISVLFSVAGFVVLASQADAGPPVLAPPKGTVNIAPANVQIQKPPPPGSPDFRPNIVINPGKAPTNPLLKRVEGVCYQGQECILFGQNLGKRSGIGNTPSGYEIVATTPPTLKVPKPNATPLTVTAWNENLIAFTGVQPGSYTIVVRTVGGGKVVASLPIRIHVDPAYTESHRVKVDEDGDNHFAVATVGDDCDDTDARRFVGNVEVDDFDDKDEDCNPATFGSFDGDHDGHPDAMACNIQMAGSGADRYFQFNCGDDCDDRNNAVMPGAMVCDPRGLDPSIVVLCVGHSGGGPADPRGAFYGTWAAVSCTSYAGPTGHCIRQVNGTGVCVP